MKNILFLFLILLVPFNIYGQDSIVNYLDKEGKIIDKINAVEIETIVKKDSLWEVTKYYRNGKIKQIGHFKTKYKTIPIGEFLTFNRKGKISRIIYYDFYGMKNGLSRSWFDNGNISSFEIYQNDKKEGKWKYYHYNGNEACRLYYKNNSILKTIIYDEKGIEIHANLIEFQEPSFKEGLDIFRKRLGQLHNNLDYQVVGKIYLSFIIDIDGNITDVETSEKLPKELDRRIRIYLENIKGWDPAFHMNRRYPYNFELPLNFSVKFHD